MDEEITYSSSSEDDGQSEIAAYEREIRSVGRIFLLRGERLSRVRALAQRIREGMDRISPFIQEATMLVCPRCLEVCCLNRHGFHNYEDLVYLSALGLKPPPSEPGRVDSDPCRFLGEEGCSLERSVRPSGCNWYFCDALLEVIEHRPDCREFDDSLRDLAELWMEMMEEFQRASTPAPA